MSYYFSAKVQGSFDDVIDKVTQALQEKGFGVLTTIDVSATLKKKLDADFRPYTILGACNPKFALQALERESHIGAMLPCNVIVQKQDDGIEVAAIDPIASMAAIENEALGEVATQVQDLLKDVIDSLA